MFVPLTVCETSVKRGQEGQTSPRCTGIKGPSHGVAPAPAPRHVLPLHEDTMSSCRKTAQKPSQKNREPPEQPQVSKISVRQTKFWATPQPQSSKPRRDAMDPQGHGDQARLFRGPTGHRELRPPPSPGAGREPADVYYPPAARLTAGLLCPH